ncbi:aldose 1-epimerase family protein [Gottfriedia acidiceleris]|uniref:aldose 1-epimerase family protein n=1 Tax=Gottfriedia acidiceleris TaxID=371036 RepID=UPI000B4421B6|nr:aldose 1-epimerase family protein [Gottfriedia acidiceleris]
MSNIENEFIKITTKSQGAELTGIYTKKDNLNYLWNANPAYWGRHAPVLFPNVGKLIDNQYKVDNKVYELSQHGFARDMDFQLTEINEDEINYELISSEQTLLKYPFQFSLNINYKIKNNTVFIKYVVTNNDQKSMPFSIGAHPAFNIPLKEDETFEDYYLQFEEEERLETIKLEGPYRSGKRELIAQNIKNLPLTRELFKDDALIFEKLNKNVLTIRSKNHNNIIKVHFEGFPYIGIWTTQTAPFLCIEPWYGIADEIGPVKEMKNKLGIQILNPNETFTCTYSITVESD